jgi:tRNA G18 (ribose-2'-O)-methylase SpoU
MLLKIKTYNISKLISKNTSKQLNIELQLNHINMFGKNSSMNVTQATNIALYEITKQLV